MRVMVAGCAINAPVVQENAKTLWVRLPGGRLIKRHKEKHVIGADVIDTDEIKLAPALPWWRRLWAWIRSWRKEHPCFAKGKI